MISTSTLRASPDLASLSLRPHDAVDRPSSRAHKPGPDSDEIPIRYSTDSIVNSSEDERAMPSAFTSGVNGHNGYYKKDLPRLQAIGESENGDQYAPVLEDDPSSFDLVAPPPAEQEDTFSVLEKQTQALFSRSHLQVIFADPGLLLKFTSFLGAHRPQSVPILVHYLDSLKSLRAIHYANAICEGLDPVEGLDFTQKPVKLTINTTLEDRAHRAFEVLVDQELPAFIAHQYIQIVSASVTARITGALSPLLREASDGLAEVFCLTDPSRQDNPIVFASEEFNRITQYGMNYIVGRNCRFLQGPMTNPHSINRIRDAIKAGKQHQEVVLNYRRDGSPFVNLLLIAPLADSRGVVRYHIGAQVDVSGLVKDCAEMESLQKLMELRARGEDPPLPEKPNPEKNDELRELSEMLNQGELNTIRRYGGRMHREVADEDLESVSSQQPRLLLKDPDTMTPPAGSINGRLTGVYQHYLLVRPYPSLRILFASPTQRLPGVLQSPFMNKIGGSSRVKEELTAAFAEGRGVTAKVRWISRGDEQGKNKWIHCTPLVGHHGQIGVWMVVIVDDEQSNERWSHAAGRLPPSVATPERPRTPGSGLNGQRVFSPTQNSSANMNGSHYEHNGSGSAGSGSVTSFRIG
ncbi:non-specific serine/threonine protein kinase [Exophiala viscosa]|uniref:Non-specific serine/threonine protein kinase n=1 Tax=Exophiala viscosa TaxID=2486360 RepID=A0AAN6E5C7_9EURO|nr:non-specific serine/threonine protein kinase [Exophiala viscosa]